MQKQDVFDNTDDEISLTDLLATIWRARWAIVVITLLVMAGGWLGSLQSVKYKSHGFFQFGGAIPLDKLDKETGGGITLADYKRYSASYGTSERFADFVQDKKLGASAGVDGLRQVFSSRDGVSKLIEPIYPFTKLDAKELVAQTKESSNNIIGLSVSYESKSPEIAQQMVGLLGRYAMDSIIYVTYYDLLRAKPEEIKAKLARLDNAIINNKVRLEEYHRKAAELKQIFTRNPGASSQSQRQVVTVTEDSASYLSPATQLMAMEVRAFEANEAIIRAKREQLQNALLLEYYDRAKLMLEGTKSGETALRGLEPLKASVFKGKDLQDDAVREVYNLITIDNQAALSLYLEKSRFIAGPNLPGHTTARPVRTLAVSMTLGLFLSLMLVFARKWWRDNKLQLSA